ncbi:LEA type 2 family protein [candidate division KSB1 bacterium]|nr:LEA type 2 family protein [candidate division KSB1 bacterium]
MHQKLTFKLFFILAISTLTIILFQCAALQEMVNIQKPRVSVNDVRLTGLNLQKINLVFDVNIQNPNALSATLAGFDYDFQLGGSSFITGRQDKQLIIESMGQSQVEIPVSLTFKEIYQTYQSLKNQDSTNYKLACGLMFDLPVLGRTRIPVSKSGDVPLIKIPKVNIGSLKLKKLSFSGADLLLNLELDNPNNFSFVLDKLNYDFAINSKTWAKGLTQEKLSIKKKGKSTVSIPLTLNFMQMGRTIYNIITSNKTLNYNLIGDVDLNSSIPMMKNVNLPINRSGQIKILK